MTQPRAKRRGATSARKGGFWFDEEAAERACSFFEDMLVHVKGEWAGQPFVLEPWQRDIVRNLFGWKRPDGTRRYRIAYIEGPRKNGKSTLVAGIGLYLLTADGEKGGEVYSAASDREQAAVVFSTAKSVVQASPELAARCETYHRSIVVPRTGSSYKVLSADVPTKHGLNPSGILFDELHAQPNRELWETLVTGGAARRQPLVVAITTAGYDRQSICYELHDHAVKVRDGVIRDDAFLPVIYAAGEKEDWASPKAWKRANPSLGICVKTDFLREECERANENPRKAMSLRRIRSPTRSSATSGSRRTTSCSASAGTASPTTTGFATGTSRRLPETLLTTTSSRPGSSSCASASTSVRLPTTAG